MDRFQLDNSDLDILSEAEVCYKNNTGNEPDVWAEIAISETNMIDMSKIDNWSFKQVKICMHWKKETAILLHVLV